MSCNHLLKSNQQEVRHSAKKFLIYGVCLDLKTPQVGPVALSYCWCCGAIKVGEYRWLSPVGKGQPEPQFIRNGEKPNPSKLKGKTK